MTTDIRLDAPADTRVMRIVYAALRRDLRRAHEALTRPPYPFDSQRLALADHLLWMMSFLHHHHESEDEHLYPLVRQRNQSARDLLDTMNRDHQTILPAITAVERAATAYHASRTARPGIVSAVVQLSALLLPHLEREERDMMPIVSQTITEAEWRHWDEEYNIKPLGPVELSDQGLFILDSAPPEDRHAIEELVPPIPRWLILHLMIRRYRRAAFRRWRTPEFSPLKSPLTGTFEAITTAPPQSVWDILADITRVGEWSHECRRARWLHSATFAAEGVQFRGYSKSGFMRWSRKCTFTTLDEPHKMVWITHGGIYGDSTEWQFVLTPTIDGTRITQSFRILSLPVWFDRMISTLLPAHHDRSRALHGDIERLAHLAESQAANNKSPNNGAETV